MGTASRTAHRRCGWRNRPPCDRTTRVHPIVCDDRLPGQGEADRQPGPAPRRAVDRQRPIQGAHALPCRCQADVTLAEGLLLPSRPPEQAVIDRLKVYGSSSLSGSVRSDAGDLLLDAASRVAIAGGLTLRSGSDLLIGDSGALQNRISFRNVGSGTMPTPPTNHCYVWFAGDPSPKELRAKFPNGVVKVLANDT